MIHACRRSVIVLTILIASTTFAQTAPTTVSLPPLPAPTKSFDAGTLHIDQFGEAGRAPLILIPGLASGAWVWSGTIAHFAPAHTIYVITLPGFDGRPAAKHEKSLFAAFRRDFWEMLRANKIEKPLVLGHSLGGTLSIALAEEHPEQLTAAIAADGLPVFPMLANATPEQRQAAAEQMARSQAAQSDDQKIEAFKGYMTMIGTNRPELVEQTARLLARSDAKATADWMQEDLSTDLRADLPKAACPLLIVMPYDPSEATQFPMMTRAQKQAFYQSLVASAPHPSVAAISPSRHFVMLDQSDEFDKTVSSFLTNLPAVNAGK